MANIDTNTLLQDAQNVVNSATNKATNGNIGASIRDGLVNSASSIQNILNDVFKNNGLVTQEQVNALDEQVKLAKVQLLQAESQKTTLSLALYIGIGIAIIGTLWYFTSKEK